MFFCAQVEEAASSYIGPYGKVAALGEPGEFDE
jgi:hypothetical protein